MSAAIGRNMSRVWLGSAAAMTMVLSLVPPVQAQDTGSVSDYRLPDPNRTPAPRVQGPVDPDNPYSVPSGAPQPQRTPAPTPTPAPSTAPRVVVPAPLPSQQPSPSVRERAEPNVAASPTPRASATPTPAPAVPPVALPTSDAAGIATPEAAATDDAPLVTAPAPAPAPSGTKWLIPAAIATIVIGGAAALFLRRRRRPVEEVTAAEAPIAAPPPPPVRPLPASPMVVPPRAAPEPAGAEPLAIDFAPQAIRLSLVYATLQYELAVRNTASQATASLQVRADLSSAHASIPTPEQLAPSPDRLELKHEVAPLQPGETTTLKGEVRVPLQQIRPLVKGGGSFLVPLVRFCILSTDSEGTALRRVFTAGPRDPGSGAIASVRLDAGPRNLRELDSREIEAARSFALDPVAAHS